MHPFSVDRLVIKQMQLQYEPSTLIKETKETKESRNRDSKNIGTGCLGAQKGCVGGLVYQSMLYLWCGLFIAQ